MAWLQSVDDRDLHVSAVTLGDIQAGIEKTREQDEEKAAEIEAWANKIAALWNVLPMDAVAFREHLSRKGLPKAIGECQAVIRGGWLSSDRPLYTP